MKRLILTLAVLAAPGLAVGQTATTAPDPDTTVSSEWAVTTPTGELTETGAALYRSDDASTAAAEATLREVIAAAQDGEFVHPDMSESVAAQMAAQQATLVPLVQGFGAIREVQYAGLENYAEHFLVAFDNALTEWVIGFNDDGKIGILRFRPAPAEAVQALAAPAAEQPLVQ